MSIFKTKQIKHAVPFTSQHDDAHVPKEWQDRACGIVALKMISDHGFRSAKTVPVQILLQTTLDNGGYMQDIGWKHESLVDLAKQNGFHAYRKEFRIPYIIYNYAPKSILDFAGVVSREYGIFYLKRKIKKGIIPIVSLSTKNGGHLVPVVGYGVNRIERGFYYNDSAEKTQESGYHKFISYTDFRKKWRKLSILTIVNVQVH